jgi:hypothetical protein
LSRRGISIVILALAAAAFAVWLRSRGGGERPGGRASVSEAGPGAPGAGGAGAPEAVAPEAPADGGAGGAPGKRGREQADALRKRVAEARQRRTGGGGGGSGGGSGTPAATVSGDLDKDYIRARVREVIPLLAECYDQALERQPDLRGRLVVKFVVAGEPDVGGVIESSEVDAEQSTMHEAELHECVRETMYAMEFEAPAAGGTISVTYPFEFRPDGPEPDAGRPTTP